MKNFILGLIVGAFLFSSMIVHADDVKSLIGKSIQGEYQVSVDGQNLDTTAIIVDGSSYLPVRALGEATGYSVSFYSNSGIQMKKKEVNAVSNTETTVETTYNGLKAVTINGNTFFKMKSYNDKFDPVKWGYDKEKNELFLAKTVKGSSQILDIFNKVSKDEPGAFINVKGESYINVKYFSEH